MILFATKWKQLMPHVVFAINFQTCMLIDRCFTCKHDIWQHFSCHYQASVDIFPPTKKVPCIARAHKLMCGCQDSFICQLWQLTDKMGTHSRSWLAANAWRLPRGLFRQHKNCFQQHEWKLKWAFRSSSQLGWTMIMSVVLWILVPEFWSQHLIKS